MTLLGYQEAALADVTKRIRRAVTDFREDGDRTAISLSAPTGSGKTIMAAAVIEQLMFGGGGHAGNPRLSVLWVSDNPSLNEQTRDKFMRFSSRFTIDRLPVIGDEDPLNAPSMESGKIYFLNTQKLGAGATTFQKGDGRDFSLWDAINGTGKDLGTNFLLVIDEAHRGTGKPARGGNTLLGRLVKGDKDLPHPAPVVLGISATPDRFVNLVGSSMSMRYIGVDIDLVRESGLVKDKVVIAHPTDAQIADATLLEWAAQKRQDMTQSWGQYTEAEGLAAVEPVLLVQIPAAESEVRIERLIDTLVASDRSLRSDHFVHALETHRAQEFGKHTIRWIEPSKIQETAGIKVVLFKEALTTGWDCPRAEVLISLRGAEDDTYITQLLGRMVRTPLAQRVETMDALNQVWVYLPHFNKETVQRVVDRLKSGDDVIPSDVEINPVALQRNPLVSKDVRDAVWTVFADFPTNTRPTKTARSNVDRATTLGLILAGHGVSGVGSKTVRKAITDALISYMERDDIVESIDAAVKDYESISFTTLSVDWMTGEVVSTAEGTRAVSAANVVDLFNAAKRKLPGGAAIWLWDRLCDTRFPDDPDRARLYTAAVAFHSDSVKTVEQTAQNLFTNWYKHGKSKLLGDREALAQANLLLAQSRASEPTTITRPDQATVRNADCWWPKHLLSAKAGQISDSETDETYPTDMYPWEPSNSWEQRVLETELDRNTIVAWYRNPAGGTQAIGVPWGEVGKQRVMYPDFVFFRQEENIIVVDIVDPHRPDLGDTVPKWAALSAWAKELNDGKFDLTGTLETMERRHGLARVWAVIDDGQGGLQYVDLLENPVRQAFADLASQGKNSEDDIRSVFDKYGADYLSAA
ncbi:DEAD/DEAH box helicase family protein [Streptomyces sp. NBC_00341]|uniref:DEAD/DEAH box helicase n=1 Tax=Streptomyces sp. NBC_00341 TaxID=2975717 RepID=UPI00308C3D7F|nr:DEAD/DEAH box helicase family protein [Streptomyces sp. NBC_00341]